MIKLFTLIDTSSTIDSEILSDYTISNRTIEVIHNSEQLTQAMKDIETTPFIQQ